MSVEVNLKGLDDLVDEMNLMFGKLESQTFQDKILIEAATPILEEAQETTAFIDRTYDLRNSLEITKPKRRNPTRSHGQYRYTLVRAKSPHAHLVELGTSRAAAHPFLEPAYIHHKEQAYAHIKKRLQEALRS